MIVVSLAVNTHVKLTRHGVMCVPVFESQLQRGAVGLQSFHSNTHLLGLSLSSLQSGSQTFVPRPQPLDAPGPPEGERGVKRRTEGISFFW